MNHAVALTATESTELPNSMELHLSIRDPEVIGALSEHNEARSRHDFAVNALRVGVLALQHVRGHLDADAIRHEGERMTMEVEKRLSDHQRYVTSRIETTLKEYFDPTNGRFSERVDRLVKRDGELEQILRRQVGGDGSELVKTLTNHLGVSSPLMTVLGSDGAGTFVSSMAKTVHEVLAVQRDRILGEFSLDNKEGALHRFVTELAERQNRATADLRGSIDGVVQEFSLDKEDSALSRLVRRVESAQKQISSEFSLDADTSALARMRKELLTVLDRQREENAKFQTEVVETLSSLKARRDEAMRSTAHGNEFEAEVVRVLDVESKKTGDIFEHVGETTGLIKNCKKGDCVVELGPETAAPGARLVIEAKEDASYTTAKALREIEEARKNRGAEVGVFVFSSRTAAESQAPFARFGNDVLVVWNADDPSTDVCLLAGLSLGRALCTRKAIVSENQAADVEAIERAIRDIEKQASGLAEIVKWTGTIKGNAEKVIGKSESMSRAIETQVAELDEHLRALRADFDHE